MQDSNYLKLVDPAYRLRQSKQYHLNVRLTGNSFSYSVFDPGQTKFIALFDARSAGQPINFEPYVEDDDLLKQSFGITRLMYASRQFLLVPEKLYEEAHADTYLASSFEKPGEVMVSNPIPGLGARLLSTMRGEDHAHIEKNFRKPYLYHEGGPFITGLLKQYQGSGGGQLCLNAEGRYMEIAFLVDGSLQLYNRFDFENADQFIYFPLFVCKQLGLDPAETPLVVFGVIDESSELYKRLYTYFRHVDLGELPSQFRYSKRLYDVPQHYFYSLISMQSCE